MAPFVNYEQHAHRLIDPDLTLQARLQMAMEVRNSLVIAHTSEYINFLKYFGAFQSILITLTKPQFDDNAEHKLRNIVVEILNRLPHSEVLRLFVRDLLKLSLTILNTDNEDNALVSVRIIFDLLRNFRPLGESEVQPFLDFVVFSQTNLVTPELEPKVELVDEVGLDPAPIASFVQLNRSTCSFKIVTKIPLVVTFLFQLYTSLFQSKIFYLLPLMVHAISIPGPEKILLHLKTQFIDLKDVQVKAYANVTLKVIFLVRPCSMMLDHLFDLDAPQTLSFLTYLLKSHADYIRLYEKSIRKSIMNLLVTCPDVSSIRREVLLALKHGLSTDFKKGLFPLIHTLLDERYMSFVIYFFSIPW